MLSLLDILFPDATLKLIKQLSLLIMFPYPKTIQPQSTYGILQKNIMVGTIGQLGMLPYGFATTKHFTA